MDASWQLRAAVRLLRERGLTRAAMAVADRVAAPEEALVLARLALGMTRYELACRGYDAERDAAPLPLLWVQPVCCQKRAADHPLFVTSDQARWLGEWLLTGYYTAAELVAAKAQLANEGKRP